MGLMSKYFNRINWSNFTCLIILIFLLAIISGCAAKPESISPQYISHMTYKDWTCEQLGQEQNRIVNALSTACEAQYQARSNDIAGVILIGLPVSSLSGSNQAAQISRLKGELQAIQQTGTLKNCGIPEPPDVIAQIKEKKAQPNLEDEDKWQK